VCGDEKLHSFQLISCSPKVVTGLKGDLQNAKQASKTRSQKTPTSAKVAFLHQSLGKVGAFGDFQRQV